VLKDAYGLKAAVKIGFEIAVGGNGEACMKGARAVERKRRERCARHAVSHIALQAQLSI